MCSHSIVCLFVLFCFVFKSVFILAYYYKCTKQYELYSHLLPHPVPSTECRTRARSELLNVSIVSPRVKFYTGISVPISQHSKCYEVYIVDPKLMDPIVELSLFQDGIVKVLAYQLYEISA